MIGRWLLFIFFISCKS